MRKLQVHVEGDRDHRFLQDSPRRRDESVSVTLRTKSVLRYPFSVLKLMSPCLAAQENHHKLDRRRGNQTRLEAQEHQ